MHVHAHGAQQAELLIGGNFEVLVAGESPRIQAAHRRRGAGPRRLGGHREARAGQVDAIQVAAENQAAGRTTVRPKVR